MLPLGHLPAERSPKLDEGQEVEKTHTPEEDYESDLYARVNIEKGEGDDSGNNQTYNEFNRDASGATFLQIWKLRSHGHGHGGG